MTVGANSRYRKAWAAALILAAIVLVVWRGALDASFVLDDIPAIVRNPTIASLWPPTLVFPEELKALTVAGRPLVNFTLAVDYALGGLAPRQYHATNLAIHLAAALALFGLLFKAASSHLVRSEYRAAALPLAFSSALLWAVHPLTTQAVTYAVQRAESLMALFFILTLLCLAHSAEARKPARWLFPSVFFCALGMGAKEVMAVCPFAALLFDRAFIAGSFRGALRARKAYYAAVFSTLALAAALIVSSGMRGGTAGSGAPYSMMDYLLLEGWAILRYLKLAVFPADLVFDYGNLAWLSGRPILWIAGLAVAALLFASGFAAWKRPAPGFCALAFFLVLAPTSSLVPILDPIYEHRMYLPLAALCALFPALLFAAAGRLLRGSPVKGRGWIVFAVALVCAAPLAYATALRNDLYRRPVELWRDTAVKVPQNYRARFNYGIELMESGRPGDAAAEFEAALYLTGGEPKIQYNLGKALAESGRLAEGVRNLSEALERGGYPPQGVETLADALVKAGRGEEAAKWYMYVLEAAVNADQQEAALRIRAKLAALERGR